jgi:hypothetical protein
VDLQLVLRGTGLMLYRRQTEGPKRGNGPAFGEPTPGRQFIRLSRARGDQLRPKSLRAAVGRYFYEIHRREWEDQRAVS